MYEVAVSVRGVLVPAALVVALTFTACASEQNPVQPRIPIATQTEPAPGETPAACAAALIRGRLVSNDRWGIALVEEGSGLVRQVVWPGGFQAWADGPSIVLRFRERRIGR